MNLRLVLALVLTVPLCASAMDCDERQIKDLLFSAVPAYRGVVTIVNSFVNNPEDRQECLERISKSTFFVEDLNAGRAFRDSYLGLYQQSFSSPGDRNLVLTPDLEILRRIYAEIEFGRRRRDEAPPKEWEIRQRALSETLSRYGLPTGMSSSEFEKLGKSDPQFYEPLIYFRRLENRLRETMVSSGPTTLRSPDQFKSMMVEQINRLRAENFRDAARRALPEWRNHLLKFKDVHSGQVHKVRVEDLATMPVQFLKPETGQFTDAEIAKALKKSSGSAGTAFARGWVEKMAKYYLPVEKPVAQVKETVQLRAEDGRPLFISEEDFVNVLQSIGPRSDTNYFDKNAAEARFRMESMVRDSQLVNSAGFLRGQKDLTLEDLYMRLKKRIDNRAFDQRYATVHLTTELNIAANLALAPAVQSDILWFGWRLNPQHWRLRDETAARLKARIFEAVYADPPTKKETVELKRQTRRELKKVAWRYQSDDERNHFLAKRTSVTAAKTAAWASALFLIWHTDFATVKEFIQNQLPQFEKPQFEKPELPWDFKGFLKFNLSFNFGLGMFGSGGGLSMDQEIEADNYEISEPDQEGEGEGGSKERSDPHNPATSPYAVEIIHKKKPDMTIPNYFNFANERHLPAVVREGKRWQDWSDSDELAYRPTRYIESIDPDLIVDVNFRNRATAKDRIGLLQLAGFDIAAVELYDWKHKRVSLNDYLIYSVKSNRQNFIQLTKSHNGPFTFRIAFKATPETYSSPRLSQGISTAAVLRVNGRLQTSGFADLSKAIPLATQNARENKTDLKDVANQFQISSTYTYQAVTWPVNSQADPVFAPFTKFLNQGHLYYQCTGSNLLSQAFLNETFKEAGEVDMKALPLVGYMASSERGVFRKSPAHLHTLVTKSSNSKVTGEYLELDATPSGPNPAATPRQPPPPRLSEPVLPKEKQKEYDQPWILPTRPQIENEPKDLEEEKKEPPEPAPQPEPAFAPSGASEIERILSRVREARRLAVEAFKPIYNDQVMFKRHDFVDMPGLRLLALSGMLLDAFKHQQGVEQTLAKLQYPKAANLTVKFRGKDAIGFADQFFRDELVQFRFSIAGIEQSVQNDGANPFDFLLNDPVRSRFRELAELLSVYPWGTLLSEHQRFSVNAAAAVQPATCESLAVQPAAR